MHIVYHYLVVIVAVLVCYHNNTEGDLVHDDIFAIKTNADVTGDTELTSVFLHDFWGNEMWDPKSHKSYRPLCTLTFRLNYYLHQFQPRGYHLVNNFFHIIASCIFFYVCDVIIFRKRFLATLAALIFAVHPVHVEAVSGIVGRADILACIFFQISFIAYWRSAKADQIPKWQKHRWKLLAVSLVGSVCGMLCKEHAISVLGVCVAYDSLVLNRKALWSSLLGKGPWLTGKVALQRISITTAATCIILVVRLLLNFGQEPFINKQDNPASFSSSIYTRVLTYLHVYALNGWLLLCPVRMSYDWQMGSVPLVEGLADPRNLTSLLFMASLVTLASCALRQCLRTKRPSTFLGLLFLVVPFVPGANVFFRVGFVLAERFLYIPSQGYAILVASGFGQVERHCSQGKKTKWTQMIVFLIFLMSLRTFARNKVWRNRTALFTSGLQSLPNNAKMHYNYGNLMKDGGHAQIAIAHYKVALRLWPEHASSYNNLATLVENREEAERLYQLALRYNPSHAGAHVNLGVMRMLQNRSSEAVEMLRRAVDLAPGQADHWTYLAEVLQQAGRLTEAEDAYKQVLKLTPRDANAFNNLAVFLNRINRPMEARHHYLQALHLQPDNHVTMVNLARLLRDQGQTNDAGDLFKRALAVSRDVSTLDAAAIHFYSIGKVQDALGMFKEAASFSQADAQVSIHYGQVLAATGQLTESTEVLKGVVREQPRNPEALSHLGSVLGLQGRHSEALDCFKKAVNASTDGSQLGILHEKIGNVYKDTGQYIEAREAYVKALRFDPDLGETQLNLGVLYHMQGDYQKAKICYLRAESLLDEHSLIRENLRKLSVAERTRGNT